MERNFYHNLLIFAAGLVALACLVGLSFLTVAGPGFN